MVLRARVVAAIALLCALSACRRVPGSLRGLSSASPSGAPTVAPKDVEERAFVAPSVGIYAVFLPPGYSDPANASTRYPLVVILHGSGSTELAHGALADDFGREGIVYVAVRAPYPSVDAFIDDHKPGWTAWPCYPDAWGEPESSTFPKADVDLLRVEHLYTEWIAMALTDARGRYRVLPDRAVVVGHSQGGTFAHRFAVDHADMVRAYVAIAGRHKVTNSDPTDAITLREHGVAALVLHHEADAVVPVKGSRDLIEYLKANHVRTESFISPGGNHRVGDAFKGRVRDFIRRELGLAPKN